MLRLNSERLIAAVKANLDRKLQVLCEYACNEMQKNIDKIPDSGSHKSVGASNWREGVRNAIQHRAYNEAFAVVRKFGLVDADELTMRRGLLISYGMGNTLDQSNPFLEEYMGSEYYDSNRGGFNVYRREGDQVFDYESGTWYTSTAKGRSEIKRFWQEPSLFFDTVMVEVEKEFHAIIATVFDDINFSEFFENTTNRR